MNLRESPNLLPQETTASEVSVGAKVASGAAWMTVLSLMNKLLAFASQLCVARLLLPEDFGVAAIAVSVSSMAGVISGMNIKTVLVQRQASFQEDAAQVFWLSVAMGAVGSLLIVIAAPFAATLTSQPKAAPLIYLVAATNFLNSVPAVWAAALSCDLKFRTQAAIQFFIGLINNFGAVGFAALHFGPYSLILPGILSAAFALAAQRAAAGPMNLSAPKLAKCRELLAPAGFLMLHSLLSALLSYGSNLIVGALHGAETTGFYFWGFSLATQAVFLLSTNLQGILFPALARLNCDSQRQTLAFERAAKVLLFGAVLIAVLQILFAEPAIRMLFGARWIPAAPVVRGLSLAIFTQPLYIVSGALFLARGDYRTLCSMTALATSVTLTATFLGGRLGDQGTTANFVGIAGFFTNLVAGGVGLRALGTDFGSLLRLIRIPVAMGVVAFVIGWILIRTFGTLLSPMFALASGGAISAIYLGCGLVFVPDVKNAFRPLLIKLLVR